jgi:hypothetical protein
MHITPPPAGLETAHSEAAAYCTWLLGHGYDADVWQYETALDGYGNRRTVFGNGYAVKYAGQLIRDDGSRAEYPSAGIKLLCEDHQLPLAKLVHAGRALITLEDDAPVPYYVACYNPRDTELRNDQAVNPGTLMQVNLHKLTRGVIGDGPHRFYDIRLTRVTWNN